MKSRLFLAALALLGLLTAQSHAQDTTARSLQGWLDFLGREASMGSIVNRIGGADWEKDAGNVIPKAQLYAWENRFYLSPTLNGRLELLVVPDENPTGSQPIAVGILDPRTGHGVYLPWARRYVDGVPPDYHIPRRIARELEAVPPPAN